MDENNLKESTNMNELEKRAKFHQTKQDGLSPFCSLGESSYKSGDQYYGGLPAEPEYKGPGKDARYYKELTQYFKDVVAEYPEYHILGSSPVTIVLRTPDGKETIDLKKFDACATSDEAIEMASHYFDDTLFESADHYQVIDFNFTKELMYEVENYLYSNPDTRRLAGELSILNNHTFGILIENGDWKHEHHYLEDTVSEYLISKGLDFESFTKEVGTSDSDCYSAWHYFEIKGKEEPMNYDVEGDDATSAEEAQKVANHLFTPVKCRGVVYAPKLHLEESTSADRLSLSDLMLYPYHFSKIWKSAPNSTYGDDFLELAEKYGCIQLVGPLGTGVDSRSKKFFICKNRSDYDDLTDALSNSNILRDFISMTPLRETNWEEITSVTDRIYVDRYIGGYTVKFPKKSKHTQMTDKIEEKKNSNKKCKLIKDAGNVEHNIAMFNHMSNPAEGPCNNPVSGPFGGDIGSGEAVGESLNESTTSKLRYEFLDKTYDYDELMDLIFAFTDVEQFIDKPKSELINYVLNHWDMWYLQDEFDEWQSELEESIQKTESFNKETVELKYHNLKFTQYGNKRDADDWDEQYRCVDWTYRVDKDDLYTFIFEYCIDEEDFPAAFEDEFDPNKPEDWNKFVSWLDDNFDTISSKYEEKILENWKDYAIEDATENYEPYYYEKLSQECGGSKSMKITELNEDFLDSTEYIISKYEEDIKDLMSYLHAAYMRREVDTDKYADALRRVYNVLDSIDCSDVTNDSDTLQENSVSSKLPDSLDQFLQDVAQMTATINYTDIMYFNPTELDMKKLRNLRAKWNRTDFDDEDRLNALAKDVVQIVKDRSPVDDDFDDLSSFNQTEEIKKTNTLYGVSDSEIEIEKIKQELEYELRKQGLRINPEKNSLDAAAEYIYMGGSDYSVNQWIEDTKINYPNHLI